MLLIIPSYTAINTVAITSKSLLTSSPLFLHLPCFSHNGPVLFPHCSPFSMQAIWVTFWKCKLDHRDFLPVNWVTSHCLWGNANPCHGLQDGEWSKPAYVAVWLTVLSPPLFLELEGPFFSTYRAFAHLCWGQFPICFIIWLTSYSPSLIFILIFLKTFLIPVEIPLSLLCVIFIYSSFHEF